MAIRQSIYDWVAVVMMLLSSDFVLGQERPIEIAPAEKAPIDLGPTAGMASPAPKSDAMPMGMEGFGMGGPGMGGPGMGGPGYSATWYPTRPVTNGPTGTDLGLVRQSVTGMIPMWKDGGDAVMLMANVGNSSFHTDAVLPDSNRAFPKELWNISVGMMYMHKFENGWTAGGGVNFGSASDKPFYSLNVMTVGFNAFLQMPSWNDRDFWKFSLMYSPVGTLNFPIPGVAYMWNPSDSFHMSIGMPFMVMWKPVEDLAINLMYVPLTNVNARATYRLADGLFIFGGYEWVQEAYLLADREDQKDRFMSFEQRLISGIRWNVRQHATFEFNAGYAFDRYYGIGQNQIGNLRDKIDIAPGAFIAASLRVRF